MEKLTVAFCTLGCKVNQYETNAMEQEFKNNGYDIVRFEDKADVYIINTCTVTNMADRKSRQMIRRVKELNPNAILAAVGCYAQVAKEELEKISEIDLILGNNEKKNIIEIVENLLKKKENLINDFKETLANEEKHEEEAQKNIKKQIIQETNVTDVMHCEEYVDFGDVTFTEKNRAVIKVQDGCDRFCSYCIIPFARGHIRSRNPESVISEISKIAKQGIKEVVITGIHLASYGRDFKKEDCKEFIEKKVLNIGKKEDNARLENNSKKKNNGEEYKLIDLLEEINKIEGIERIRLRVIRANINHSRICSKIIKTRKNM